MRLVFVRNFGSNGEYLTAMNAEDLAFLGDEGVDWELYEEDVENPELYEDFLELQSLVRTYGG